MPVAFTVIREYVRIRTNPGRRRAGHPFVAGTGMGIAAADPIADALSRRGLFPLPIWHSPCRASPGRIVLPRRRPPGVQVRRTGSARWSRSDRLVVTATGLLSAAIWHAAPWHVVLSPIATVSPGVGAAGTALYTGTTESAGPSDTGVASSITTVARGTGAAFEVRIAAAVLTVDTGPLTQLPSENSFQLGFPLAAGTARLGVPCGSCRARGPWPFRRTPGRGGPGSRRRPRRSARRVRRAARRSAATIPRSRSAAGRDRAGPGRR